MMNKKCSHPRWYSVCTNELDDTQVCVLCLEEEIEKLRLEIKQLKTKDERYRSSGEGPL